MVPTVVDRVLAREHRPTVVAGRVVRGDVDRLGGEGVHCSGEDFLLTAQRSRVSFELGTRSGGAPRGAREGRRTEAPNVARGMVVASVDALRVESRPVEAMERARSMLLLRGREVVSFRVGASGAAEARGRSRGAQPKRHGVCVAISWQCVYVMSDCVCLWRYEGARRATCPFD